MIRRIDQELRGELGKPHHWGVEIKWWGKRNKKEISKKNHKIRKYLYFYFLLFILSLKAFSRAHSRLFEEDMRRGKRKKEKRKKKEKEC